MSPNTLTPGIAATGLAATLPAVPANLATSDNSSPKKSNPNADAVSVRVRIGLPVGLPAPAALRPAARSPAVSAALTTFLGTNPPPTNCPPKVPYLSKVAGSPIPVNSENVFAPCPNANPATTSPGIKGACIGSVSISAYTAGLEPARTIVSALVTPVFLLTFIKFCKRILPFLTWSAIVLPGKGLSPPID